MARAYLDRCHEMPTTYVEKIIDLQCSNQLGCTKLISFYIVYNLVENIYV
jgi:hypothetical protein